MELRLQSCGAGSSAFLSFSVFVYLVFHLERLILQLALQNTAFSLHYWNCSANLGWKWKSTSRSEGLQWAPTLASLTRMVLFMWKPFRPFLASENPNYNSVPHHLIHAKGIILVGFFFFFCLWNLMILKAKAVSLINTPGTFHSSLQLFTSYLRKDGAVNCWGQDLHLRPFC